MNRVPDKVVNWAESQAIHARDTAKDPQLAAMAKAHQPTKQEREQIAAADEAVREAEAAVGAAGWTVDRARRGIPPSYDKERPFTFFEKSLSAHKAARASLPTLEIDLAEARTTLQNAIRRRNGIVREVDAGRVERRRQAKAQHTPKPEPVRSRHDGWGTLSGMRRWSGGKDAA